MTTGFVAIALSSVFVIVFTATVFSLQHTELREMRIVLAFPVSILSVLGLTRGSEHILEVSMMIDVILLPYAALALTLVFLVLLWFWSRARTWIRATSKGEYGRFAGEIGERRDRSKSEIAKREHTELMRKKEDLPKPEKEKRFDELRR